MEQQLSSHKKVIKTISKERERTNILRQPEQNLIAFLVQRIPAWIKPDGLTAIGLFGSIVSMASFILAYYVHTAYLLLGILGLFINWFGDSLDGRVAYYRNTPRKWYGFTLDYIVDWFSNILISIGFIMYVQSSARFLGFAFLALYGWTMMMALLRYKLTNRYSIDSGFLGPTEVRLVIATMLLLEVLINGSIVYSGVLICIILLTVNLIDFRKILLVADRKDKREKIEKRNKERENE